jgi:predicted RNA binding protein YcfA (HicA-like mRNA interferase family)
MKRKDLLNQRSDAGCVLYRHGSRHDVYVNPNNGKRQPVPRHPEIEDALAKHIRKFLGLLEEP